MNMRDLRKRIKTLVASERVDYPHLVAAKIVDSLEPRDVRDLARRYVEDLVAEAKRDKARRVEGRATQAAAPPLHNLPAVRNPGWRSQPTAAPKHESYPWNEKGRAACHRCGCDPCKAAMAEYWRTEEESSSKLWSSMSKIMHDYADAIRLEVTEELLASSFALGDGRQVTWGDATIEDHQVRIKLLETNAVKNIETASKHQAAIQMLQGAGAPTLGMLEAVAA